MSKQNENSYCADEVHNASSPTTDVLVVEQIGRSRYRTPDGYLYCEGVRIASTKPLMYRQGDMKKVTAKHGMVLMERPPEVLFSKDTLASFQGKSITNSHPQRLVGPKDWKDKTVGVVLNPRQGTGADAEYMIADMLVTDAKAIKDVEDGKVEVSCGYDQDHEEIKPGHGRFTAIVGNHVALVDKGRCGPQCAIGDEEDMTHKTMIERLRNAFSSNDESAFDTEMKAMQKALDDNEQRIVIEVPGHAPANDAAIKDEAMAKVMTTLDAIMDRLTKLEAANDEKEEKKEDEKEEEKEEKEEEKEMKDEKEEEKEEEKEKNGKEKAMDSASITDLRLEFQDVVAKAEILSPGIKIPTFDATANSKKTIADQMCGLRKAAMDRALTDEKRAHIVKSIIGNATIDGLECDAMKLAFNAASQLARAENNKPRVAMDHMLFPSGPMTTDKLQKLHEARRRK